MQVGQRDGLRGRELDAAVVLDSIGEQPKRGVAVCVVGRRAEIVIGHGCQDRMLLDGPGEQGCREGELKTSVLHDVFGWLKCWALLEPAAASLSIAFQDLQIMQGCAIGGSQWLLAVVLLPDCGRLRTAHRTHPWHESPRALIGAVPKSLCAARTRRIL